MRTKTQIDNLRAVLFRTNPLAAAFASDDAVDRWADALQDSVQEVPLHWLIKIRTIDDKEKPWRDISYEPTRPLRNTKEIVYSCRSLLEKYPKILSIQIARVGKPYDTYVFERDKVQ